MAAGDVTYSALFHNPDNGRFALFAGKPLILRDPAVDAAGIAPSLRAYLALTVELSTAESYVEQHTVGTEGYLVAVAEDSGLILPIGEWVIHEACRQNRAWQKANLPPIRLSVNISGIQFARQEIAQLINAALLKNKLAPNFLEVEITETAIMSQPDRAIKELSAIKALGVNVALDDFGTGYSSFSYLHRFPIDTLKIDRSFIKDISDKTDRAEIVAAMVAMAHTLKLKVVAEGIETENQFSILSRCECDALQGFLLKKPVPADEVPELLAARVLQIA